MVKSRMTQTTPYDSLETSFLMPKISAKFQKCHAQRGHQIEVGYVQIGDFRPISRYVSETVQDGNTVTMEG